MNMTKLVDRDKVIELIKMYQTDFAIREIERLPHTEVVNRPEKVAHWMVSLGVTGGLYCSACNCSNDKVTNYCPNCGAKIVFSKDEKIWFGLKD